MVVTKERRRRDDWGGGRGRSRSSGGNIVFPLIMGYIIGFVGDMFYGILGLPGYNTKNPRCEVLKGGDVAQVAAWGGLSFASVMFQSWTATAFSMGGMLGSLTPKMLAASGAPRYGIMNFDPSSGQVKSILPRWGG